MRRALYRGQHNLDVNVLRCRNYFAEAAARGYLVKNSSGQPYIQTSASKSFSFGSIDVTNPEAVQWFATVIRCNMMFDRTAHCPAGSVPANATVGVFGWMSDFGEYLPLDSVLHAGDPGTVHNLYAGGVCLRLAWVNYLTAHWHACATCRELAQLPGALGLHQPRGC